MTFPFWVPVLLLLAAAPAAWLGAAAWGRRRAPGAAPLALTALLVAAWCALAAINTFNFNPAVKQFLANLETISQSLLPVLWLLVALELTGSRPWLRRLQPWLFVIPAVTVALVFTTALFSNAGSVAPGAPVSYGPWFWVQAGYSVVLLGASLLLLGGAWLSAAARLRGQLAMLLVCLLLPLAWITTVRLLPPDTAAPVVLALSSLLLVWGLFSLRLFELAPLAQAAVVAGLREAVVIIDLDQRIADFNPAAAQLFGWTSADPRAGRGQPAALALAAWPELAEMLHNPTAASPPADLAKGLGADRRVFELGLSPLTDAHGRRVGQVLSLRDATEHHRIEDELARLATTDELTGLADRQRAYDALREEVRRARRYESTLALLLMDLDQFKTLNQAIGRQAGDDALRAVARAIQRLARQSDLPARPGSDEFIIVLPHTTLLGAETVAGRLLAAVSQIQAGPQPAAEPAAAAEPTTTISPTLRISIGAAELAAGDDDQGEALLARAERAMRAAKAAGGGRVMVMEETPLIGERKT